MKDITTALDNHDLKSAFKLSNEAVNLKYSNHIIKGLSTQEN